MTINGDATSSHSKSIERNMIAYEKNIGRDILASRDKNMSNRTKEIGNSAMTKKEKNVSAFLEIHSFYNKENNNPGHFNDALE